MAHWAAFGLLVALLVITAESRPATQTQHETLRELLGDELADLVISGDAERALAARARLLRDLRVDTRAKGVWAKIMSEQPGSRRQKTGSKKAGGTTRSGCFGHKMDRIGTLSGMGCQPAHYPSASNLS
ncbi:C-type natriuretic peptide [Colossoma macropomum]|uniref:C-type natriuretic peptide n=1 Tax=Colossoma macropomum TaxID=42526 RepID=UPI0018655B6D|nr:C-type natriuretic peptide [Colossoma macropomum]